jgi:probable phosphoglycerate mutase
MSSEAVAQPGLFPADAFRTEVLLVRHGQSAAIVPGAPESSDPPLSDVGYGQAAALAERLHHRWIDVIYASHLARAVQTAEAIAASRGLTVVQDPDLREVELGQWSNGGYRRRAAANDPEFLRFVAAGRWDLIPGSEGDGPFRHRVMTTVRRLATAHPEQALVLVCHGGVINAVLAEILGIDRSTFTPVENTSVTVIRFDEPTDRWLVVTLNDATHLYDVVAGTATDRSYQ